MSSFAPLVAAPSAPPPPAPPRPSARRDLRASVVDAGAFSVMVGAGETYLPAFVLALGLGDVAAGLVASLPLLAGAVLQLASPWAVRAMGSHRRWVMTCGALQAAAFVPLVAGAAVGHMSGPVVFAIATLYWAFGQGSGPAWNTWMDGIIPRRVRASYFAARNRVAQSAIFLSFVGGGLLLQGGASHGRLLAAFASAFAIAALARGASVRALAAQSEPPTLEVERQVPLARFAARLWRGQDGRLVLYMMAVQTSVYVAGPYFNPFMLSELRLSYAAYVGLVAAAYLARIVALPLLGAWVNRYGARQLLWVGGAGIVPMSLVWVFSTSYAYLLVVQALSGFFWAAYELATQLLFFEMIRREERTSVLTYYNVMNALAVVVGALLGGAILGAVGGRAGYLAIFTVSFVARLLTILLMRRVAVVPRRLTRLVTRVLAVRPAEGAIARPVISSIEERPAGPRPAKRRDDTR